MNKNITIKDFFFCYDREMMEKLHNEGFDFLVSGYHPVSQKRFWMFVKTDEFNAVLSGIFENIK